MNMRIVRYRPARDIRVGDRIYVRARLDATPSDGDHLTDSYFHRVVSVEPNDVGVTIVAERHAGLESDEVTLADINDETPVLRGEHA